VLRTLELSRLLGNPYWRYQYSLHASGWTALQDKVHLDACNAEQSDVDITDCKVYARC